MNLRFGCLSFLLRFEVGKWHVALHSFAVLVCPLPVCPSTLLHRPTPPRTGFLKCFQAPSCVDSYSPCWTGSWKQTGVEILQKWLKECYLDWFGFPLLWMTGTQFEKKSDTGWESHFICHLDAYTGVVSKSVLFTSSRPVDPNLGLIQDKPDIIGHNKPTECSKC